MNENPESKLGLRYNNNKPQLSLISPISLIYLSRVLEFGAKKYERDNWRNGLEINHCIDSIYRHILELQSGRTHDHESGLPIAAHIMCNGMFLLELLFSNKLKGEVYETPLDMLMLIEAQLSGNSEASDMLETEILNPNPNSNSTFNL